MIAIMGDFERVLRGSPRYERFRYSKLSDVENSEINKVYFGNPFKILPQFLQTTNQTLSARKVVL
jgi:hypothetical protein